MGFSQIHQHEGFGEGRGGRNFPESWSPSSWYLLRSGQCWLLPSSCNAGAVAESREQDSVWEVHPNLLAELGVMWRDKRQH